MFGNNAAAHDACTNHTCMGDSNRLRRVFRGLFRGVVALQAVVAFVPLSELKHMQQRARLWADSKAGECGTLQSFRLCGRAAGASQDRFQQFQRRRDVATGTTEDQGRGRCFEE